MRYTSTTTKRKKPKLVIILLLVATIVMAVAVGAIGTRLWYERQLLPATASSKVEVVTIPDGASVGQIAGDLESRGLIRNAQAFRWYIRNSSLVESIKAGTYEIDGASSTPDIVSKITDGKVQENLFTILPGQRLGQIKETFLKHGFPEAEVDEALEAGNYVGHPALVAKPTDQSLEGYLFPESFRITSKTTANEIVLKSLDEMADAVTPELIMAWQQKGLGSHQAITLASVVENEVSAGDERKQVAGVFFNRLAIGMPLESDPTYRYAAYLTGLPSGPGIESPYNTYYAPSLPPGPISNVSKSSLEAVAYPATHEFLFFVAGDDGITRFSKTLQEHEEKAAIYCIELCKSY